MGLDELQRVFAISKSIKRIPDGAKYLGQIPASGCLIRLYMVRGSYYHVVKRN